MRHLLAVVAIVAVVAMLAAGRARNQPDADLEPLYGQLTVSARGLPLPDSARLREGQIWVPRGTAARLRWELALMGLPARAEGTGSLEELQATLPSGQLQPESLVFTCDDPTVAEGAAHLGKLYLGRDLRVQRPLPADAVFAKRQLQAQEFLDSIVGDGRTVVKVTGKWELGVSQVKCIDVGESRHRRVRRAPVIKRQDIEVWMKPSKQVEESQIRKLLIGGFGNEGPGGTNISFRTLKR